MSSRDNSNAQAQADRSNSPLRKQLAKKLVGYYDQLNTSKDKDKSRNNSKERSKSRSQSKDGASKAGTRMQSQTNLFDYKGEPVESYEDVEHRRLKLHKLKELMQNELTKAVEDGGLDPDYDTLNKVHNGYPTFMKELETPEHMLEDHHGTNVKSVLESKVETFDKPPEEDSIAYEIETDSMAEEGTPSHEIYAKSSNLYPIVSGKTVQAANRTEESLFDFHQRKAKEIRRLQYSAGVASRKTLKESTVPSYYNVWVIVKARPISARLASTTVFKTNPDNDTLMIQEDDHVKVKPKEASRGTFNKFSGLIKNPTSSDLPCDFIVETPAGERHCILVSLRPPFIDDKESSESKSRKTPNPMVPDLSSPQKDQDAFSSSKEQSKPDSISKNNEPRKSTYSSTGQPQQPNDLTFRDSIPLKDNKDNSYRKLPTENPSQPARFPLQQQIYHSTPNPYVESEVMPIKSTPKVSNGPTPQKLTPTSQYSSEPKQTNSLLAQLPANKPVVSTPPREKQEPDPRHHSPTPADESSNVVFSSSAAINIKISQLNIGADTDHVYHSSSEHYDKERRESIYSSNNNAARSVSPPPTNISPTKPPLPQQQNSHSRPHLRNIQGANSTLVDPVTNRKIGRARAELVGKDAVTGNRVEFIKAVYLSAENEVSIVLFKKLSERECMIKQYDQSQKVEIIEKDEAVEIQGAATRRITLAKDSEDQSPFTKEVYLFKDPFVIQPLRVVDNEFISAECDNGIDYHGKTEWRRDGPLPEDQKLFIHYKDASGRKDSVRLVPDVSTGLRDISETIQWITNHARNRYEDYSAGLRSVERKPVLGKNFDELKFSIVDRKGRKLKIMIKNDSDNEDFTSSEDEGQDLPPENAYFRLIVDEGGKVAPFKRRTKEQRRLEAQRRFDDKVKDFEMYSKYEVKVDSESVNPLPARTPVLLSKDPSKSDLKLNESNTFNRNKSQTSVGAMAVSEKMRSGFLDIADSLEMTFPNPRILEAYIQFMVGLPADADERKSALQFKVMLSGVLGSS